ncbi:hypothetical protein TI04_03480 [Achromatium sp. WMS2]|nr:hypothetical protein TI04_03480 [Achromatium sp. WMS2]
MIYRYLRFYTSVVLLCCLYIISGQVALARAGLQAVATVIDGDTVHLVDGTKIRLAEINAPELGYDTKPDEPGAVAAKNLLASIVKSSNNMVRVEAAPDARDRYGRLIAYLYTQSGVRIQDQLLSSGLVLGYAYPPNVKYVSQLRTFEQRARTSKLGLWSNPARIADSIALGSSGFARVTGVITSIKRTQKSVWLGFGSKMSLRIASTDLDYFRNFAFENLRRRSIEVRGYLNTYHGQVQIRIRHPADIIILN